MQLLVQIAALLRPTSASSGVCCDLWLESAVLKLFLLIELLLDFLILTLDSARLHQPLNQVCLIFT